MRKLRDWVGLIGFVAAAALLFKWLGGDNHAVKSRVFTPVDLTVPSGVLFSRPKAAPNGKPWPTISAYVAGYKRLNENGEADVVVDNSDGAHDLLAKLIDLDAKPETAVRVIFCRAYTRFSLLQVKPGHYDVRYRDLDTGIIRKSGIFQVTVKETKRGKQFMGWTVPVYTAINGTTYHEVIPAEEF
jgi:hypothetical protein